MRIKTVEEARREDVLARANGHGPVRYSKYRIQLACQKRGLWEQVKSAISSAELQDSWENIVDIASDNEELERALPTIKEQFGEDVVDAVLAESIVE